MGSSFNPLTGLKRCNAAKAVEVAVLEAFPFQSPDGAKEVQLLERFVLRRNEKRVSIP